MRPSELDPERWRRIDEILEAALDLEPEEQEGWLARMCDDEAMRAEVEALLDAHARSSALFEEPPGLPGPASDFLSRVAVEGAEIGSFRIVREIGRGGMGVVYLAEDARIGRPVALKVLPPYLGRDRRARRRFEAEARAVSALDHPNIATLYAFEETEDGLVYLVFAFYEGETLDEMVDSGPMPVDRAVELAAGIAEGLGAAHRRGIVHRDVKPSNVLVTDEGQVKLLDFGVAKVAGQELTGDGVRLGTVAYMSPEQVEGGELDARADLWSLGVVLYETLTGRRPFRGSDSVSTLHEILHAEPDPPGTLRPGLPEGMDRVVAKLLSKTPADRYQTAGDLLRDLRAVASGARPSLALREPPPARHGRIERLAVLPLANHSGDPERDYLVHGVHDALIAELGKVRELAVVGRTSVMRFPDEELSVPEIAEILDVDAVVEGSVSGDGELLVVTTQLVATSPERHVWSGSYRRGVGNVFDVAAEVARSIAAELGLATDARAHRASERPVKPAVYQAFTLGRFHMERRSSEGLDLAEKYFRRALELDGEFAPAYAALAETLGSAAFFGLARPADRLPEVRILVRAALDLDDDLPAAHTTLGAVKLFGDWDWRGAEASLRRAVALNPSYAYAYFLLAQTLSVQGRYVEALSAAERNSRLEQFIPFAAFGPVIVLSHMREFERAIDRARAGREFFTDFWQGHWLLARALAGAGRYAEAVVEGEAAAEVSRRTPMALGTLGFLYARDGRIEDARRVLAELEARASTVYVAASYLGAVHVGLGDRDRAFACLERAVRERDMALVDLAHDAVFDDLRSDVRFADLLRRIGLDEGARSPGEGRLHRPRSDAS